MHQPTKEMLVELVRRTLSATVIESKKLRRSVRSEHFTKLERKLTYISF